MVRTIHNGDPNSFSSGLALHPCLTLGRSVDRLSVDLEIHPLVFGRAPGETSTPETTPTNPADLGPTSTETTAECIGVVPGT